MSVCPLCTAVVTHYQLHYAEVHAEALEAERRQLAEELIERRLKAAIAAYYQTHNPNLRSSGVDDD